MHVTTDMIAIAGLALALVIGIILGAPSEILTGISGGLSGYVCKSAVEAKKDGTQKE